MIRALQERLHWRKRFRKRGVAIIWFKLHLASRVIVDLVKLEEKFLGL